MKRAILVTLLALLAAAPAHAGRAGSGVDNYTAFVRVLTEQLAEVKNILGMSNDNFDLALLSVSAWVYRRYCDGDKEQLGGRQGENVLSALPNDMEGIALLQMFAIVIRLGHGDKRLDEYRCRFTLETVLDLRR